MFNSGSKVLDKILTKGKAVGDISGLGVSMTWNKYERDVQNKSKWKIEFFRAQNSIPLTYQDH